MATKTEPTAAAPALRVPPEEKYWKRYSPHGEAPLSFAGSFAVHIIFGGLFLFVSVWAASLFGGEDRNVPIEPVRLDLGGGGGDKRGTGTGPGGGKPQENVGSTDDQNIEGDVDGKDLP